MSKTTNLTAKQLEEAFNDGEEILQHFDFENAERPNLGIKKVNLDIPVWMVSELDKEAERLGVPRQSVMKVALDEFIKSRK